MRFSQYKKEEIGLGISIAPLIDIVFLLLIFFMLTSRFDTLSGINIDLPNVSETKSIELSGKIIIKIETTGDCYLQGEKLSLKDLYARLKNSAAKNQIDIILQADKDTRHGHVVRVIDLAKKAGVSSVMIEAQWEPEKVL